MLRTLLAAALLFAGTARAGSDSPIVFIHGIKGATLEGPAGNQLWLTGLQALGLSTPRLALPLAWDPLEGQARDPIHATGLLERVRVIPWIAEEQVYGPWTRAARSWGAPFYPFVYDWRRDNLESLASFTRAIEKIRATHGGRPVRVVAHSMGGLILLALLRTHPDYVSQAVFAGVPFRGGVGFLEDLHVGTPNGLNHAILSPEVLFTFPSIYALFPHPRMPSGLETESGQAIPMDFFSAEAWRAQALGVFSLPPNGPLPDREQALSFLTRALASAARFRSLLETPSRDFAPLPQALAIAGDSRPTLVTVRRAGPKQVRGWDFETAPRAPGDGRVALRDAAPPLAHEVFITPAEHSQLLNDVAVIARIRAFFGL